MLSVPSFILLAERGANLSLCGWRLIPTLFYKKPPPLSEGYYYLDKNLRIIRINENTNSPYNAIPIYCIYYFFVLSSFSIFTGIIVPTEYVDPDGACVTDVSPGLTLTALRKGIAASLSGP